MKLKKQPEIIGTFHEILERVSADRNRPLNPQSKTPYLQLMNNYFKESPVEIMPSKMNYQL